MTPMLLSLTLALAPAPVAEKITLPSGPPPQFVLAVFKDGKCEVTSPVLVPETRTENRTRIVNANGKQVPVQETVTVTVYVVRHVSRVIERPRAFDRSGKEVDAKRLAVLLVKPTVVLQSADGKPVDPFYLRTMKEGTLTLLLPMGPVGTAPPLPGPTTPVPRSLPMDKADRKP